MASLKAHEEAALLFLAQGPDQVGVVDSDETMAAAVTFSDLAKRGLVDFSGSGESWTAFLTTEGADLAAELLEAG